MTFSDKYKTSRLKEKVSRRVFLARKDIRRQLKSEEHKPKEILFIFGCQRSGTTLMTLIMEKDWDAKVYAEHSKLSSDDTLDRLRLNELSRVKRVIEGERYPLVVLKPLVESQNARLLLDSFKGSKALWMIRFYKDVAASNLRRFGLDNGIKNLRYIATDQQNNWRAEQLPESVRELVKSHFSEGMNPYDAAALFWYVRNTLFFQQDLEQHPSVKVCQYADLVRRPNEIIRDIYEFMKRPYPGDHIVAEVHRFSIGRGQSVELSPAIENLCDEMWDRLKSVSYTGAFRSAEKAEAIEEVSSSQNAALELLENS
jgi:hypothetical protein